MDQRLRSGSIVASLIMSYLLFYYENTLPLTHISSPAYKYLGEYQRGAMSCSIIPWNRTLIQHNQLCQEKGLTQKFLWNRTGHPPLYMLVRACCYKLK